MLVISKNHSVCWSGGSTTIAISWEGLAQLFSAWDMIMIRAHLDVLGLYVRGRNHTRSKHGKWKEQYRFYPTLSGFTSIWYITIGTIKNTLRRTSTKHTTVSVVVRSLRCYILSCDIYDYLNNHIIALSNLSSYLHMCSHCVIAVHGEHLFTINNKIKL